jgi:CHAD domain-containing protein
VICARVRDLCERESRKLLDGFGAMGALLDIEALHALRRRARRLRYAVEIFAEIFGETPGAAKPWKSLQDLIGVLHDHHVLAQWFDRQALADERRGSTVLAAAALAEADWARETMDRLHHRYLAEDPSSLVERGLSAVGFHPAPISS